MVPFKSSALAVFSPSILEAVTGGLQDGKAMPQNTNVQTIPFDAFMETTGN